ncbi:KAP family P-loop NTPase fold protein [Phytohabitans houttuyneae]|uniref:KAP family P-loop NTPase fold protein n=1 Tax=Phytohabitans houttuyneae TaxID=1076126 RepID=UPI00156447BF|nr:P-loop NTPase fold protein [Phytohabitans houttuyneae]
MSRIDDDAFGFRPYIEELHAAVAAAISLPMTVGVFGPWGSGKSSFLKMWEDLLSFAPTTRTLWFNPWKYDQKVEVWAALIQSLLAEIRTTEDETLRIKAGRLARAATWLGVRGVAGSLVGGLTGGLVSAAAMDQLWTELGERESDYYRQLNRFEVDFAETVEQFVGEQGRLVVFVDDLDRCTPAAALNVMEALKLFIGDARCVFVLAMDFDLLAAAAGTRFGELAPGSGAAYLEKIVQLPFFLPDVGFETLRYAVGPSAGPLADSEAFWELVRLGFGTNPRRVKRYLNVLNLATTIAAREGGNELSTDQRLQLAELLIIRSEHRAFFRHLLVDPGAWQRLEQSPALPPPGSADPVELVRNTDATLTPFLDNQSLTGLLRTRPGAYNDHPSAPAGRDVERMIRTVRLAAGLPDHRPGETESAGRSSG